MATDESMIVSVNTPEFGFSRMFSRKVTRKRSGEQEVSITQEIAVSPSRGEKTLAEFEARIAAELGNFPVMLDFGQFLAMSDADRRKFFYNLAGISAEEWSKEKVSYHLQRQLLPSELQENNPDAYEAQMAMIREGLEEWRQGLEPEAGVQAMLEWAKAKQKHWNAEQKKAAGAVQKLAELKNQLDQTDRNIAGNKAELDRLQTELTDIASEIARQEEAQKAIDRRAARLQEIQQEVEAQEVKDVSGEAVVFARQLDALRAQIQTAEDAERTASDLQESASVLEREIQVAEDAVMTAAEAVAKAKAVSEGLARTIEQATARGGICVIAKNIACPKDFTPFIGWAQEEHQKQERAWTDATQRHAQAARERKDLKDKLSNVQAERDQVFETARKVSRHNEEIQRKIRSLESLIERAAGAAALRDQKIATLQAEYERLASEPSGAIAMSDILLKQRDGLQQQIVALKATVEEQEKAKTTISNMKASMIDSKTAENNHGAAKYLAEELGPKGIQGKMLISALDPIRDSVTANLRTMGFARPFFFLTESTSGQEVFRFGWVDEKDREVDFDALSTGQQMIVLISLLVTILERANPPLKILAIDNVENLDRVNFACVLAGLDKMADRLDNILLAGVIDITTADAPGWTLHRLGAPVGEVMAS